jgi:glucose/arabinose dehydrogenase
MTSLPWNTIAPRRAWALALMLGLACSARERAQPDAMPILVPLDAAAGDAAAEVAVVAADVAASDAPAAADAVVDAAAVGADTVGPADASGIPDVLAAGSAAEVADAPAPDAAALVADAVLPADASIDAPVADANIPDSAPVADAAPTGPIADPIPAEPVASTLTVALEEVVTMPDSRPSPQPSDPRLRRRARINYLGELPDGSGRLFVPDLNGRLYLIKAGAPGLYLDVGAEFSPSFWRERGLGSGLGFAAFHPDFKANGIFYTVHTEAGDALKTKTPSLPSQDSPSVHGVLTEWTADDPGASAFTGTRREVLRIGFSAYLHGIQEIGFNPTAMPGDQDRGLLYLAVGDGGVGLATGDPQNLAIPHGKLLRIDPAGANGANGRYGIPSTNPFVGRPGALGEIYAYGLRDPHRFTWDQGPAPRMFVANIGEHNVESIYEVKPADNFGWPQREGPFLVRKGDPSCSVYPLPASDAGFMYPVIAYDHDPPPGFTRCLDTGDAVIGGFVYRGTGVPALRGQYLFGDIVNGRLFHADTSEMRRNDKLATIHVLTTLDEQGRPVTMQALAGDARVDLRFGRDAAGELYVLSKANGKIWRVKAPPP